MLKCVMDMVIFRTIFFELLFFHLFTLFYLHFVCLRLRKHTKGQDESDDIVGVYVPYSTSQEMC